MPDRSNVIYLYDGSFEGLLCCVFKSFEKKELPVDIQQEDTYQPSFFEEKNIPTDFSLFRRVKNGIIQKISPDAYDLVRNGFDTCHPQKERLILDFVRLGLKNGKKVMDMLGNETVSALQKAVLHLFRESHQLKGFVRFSIVDRVMVATIEPKNFVLPYLAPHFCDRYPLEVFMIYDKTHAHALIYQPKKWVITPIDDYLEPSADESEQQIRYLWKLFYDTIAIRERENPRCRMSHMQKRYWSHLTEMKDQPVPANEESSQVSPVLPAQFLS